MTSTSAGERTHRALSHPLKLRGMTLMELLAVIAIFTILFTLCVPSLRSMLSNYRMSTTVNQFVADLQLGRNEASKRWRNIVICPSATGTTCGDPAKWHAGWLVFADNDASKSWSNGDVLIRRHGRVPVNLRISSPASRPRISYNAQGASAGTNVKITFCDGLGLAQQRQVIVSNEGRIRVEKSAASCG